MTDREINIIRNMHDEAVKKKRALATNSEALYREFAPVINRIDAIVELATRLNVNLNEKAKEK